MADALVSFILPVYNAADYLQETLDSIEAQTYKNWELVAINDGSTDHTQDILSRFALKNPNTIIINRENRGLVYTLNEAIKLSSGKWLARIDADDVCHPERLEKQINWLKKTNSDLCGGIIERIGVKSGNSWVFPSSNEGIYTWLLFRSAFAHPTVIMKRDLALKFPYSQLFIHVEDYELWTRMALHEVKMTNLPEKVLSYRVHKSQISTQKKEEQTNNRIKVSELYWSHSPLSRGLIFYEVMFNENTLVTLAEFEKVIRVFIELYDRANDEEAQQAIETHLIWFFYRSLHLGTRQVFKALRQVEISKTKKAIILFATLFKLQRLVAYCRNSALIRLFPIEWFF